MKSLSIFLASLLLSSFLAFSQDGSLDNSFGTSGFANANFSGASQAFAVGRQLDGKIVVAGFTASGGAQLAVVRFNTNGSIDNTFGTNGQAIHQLSADPAVSVLAIQTDGKIVVAGGLQDPTGQRAFIARLNANGALDNTFGTAGVVEFSDRFTRVNDIKILSDGKLMGLGSATSANTQSVIGLFRRNSNGSKDANFGTSGYVYAEAGDQEVCYKMAIQPDGKMVVTGSALTPNTTSNTSVLVARFKPDGTFDTTFGTGGKVLSAFSSVNNSKDLGYDIAVQPDGKILVAGRNNPNTKSSVLICRYTSAGVLDNTFGTNGRTITTVTAGTTNEALSIGLQASGKIVVGGFVGNTFSTRKIIVLRYQSNGMIDTGFGTSGIATHSQNANSSGEDLVIQPDGKIVIVGWNQVGPSYNFVVARLSNSGTSGIENLTAADLSASVFPNPVSGEASNLKFTLENSQQCAARLFSMEGRLVKTFFDEKLNSGEQTRILDLPALDNGFYFVQLETEEGVLTLPLEILN